MSRYVCAQCTTFVSIHTVTPLSNVALRSGFLSLQRSQDRPLSTRRSLQQQNPSHGANTQDRRDAEIAESSQPEDAERSAPAPLKSSNEQWSTLPQQTDLSSTRPADLHIPDYPTSADGRSLDFQTMGSYYYRLGRAYLSFYKTGLKNVWHNYKGAREIRLRIKRNTGGLKQKHIYQAVQDQVLSRRDYQLLLRSNHDITKLAPFMLIFAVCGEFTPIVVPLFGARVVPGTCILPKQAKAMEARITSFMTETYATRKEMDPKERQRLGIDDGTEFPMTPEIFRVVSRRQHERSVSSKQIMATAYAHEISSFKRPLPLLGNFLAQTFYYSRLRKRAFELHIDDILLLREGGVKGLLSYDSFAEVRRALLARGYDPSITSHVDKHKAEESSAESEQPAKEFLQLYLDYQRDRAAKEHGEHGER